MDYVCLGNNVLSYQTELPASGGLKEQKSLEKKLRTQKDEILKLLASNISDLSDIESLSIRKFKVGKASYYKIQVETVDHAIRGYNITKGRDQKLIDHILETSGNSDTLILTHDRISEQVRALVNSFGKGENKDTLYLWSSGGGGHKSAKEAQTEKEMVKLRNQIIGHASEEVKADFSSRFTNIGVFTDWCKQMGYLHEADVLTDYVGSVGVASAESWDRAQQEGNVKKQESLASLQWLSDRVFGPVIFIQTLRDLINHHPRKVVSTQAMATPSILFALCIYNAFFKPAMDPEVKLHLYMTDMPTGLSGHFFKSLKRIWEIAGKKHLILHAPKPTDKDTWIIRCNLPDDQVVELKTRDFPVRASFLKAVESYTPEAPVGFKVTGEEESKLLKEVLKHQKATGELVGADGFNFEYQVDDKDNAYFLMLGSQPTKQAIVDYVDKFLLEAKQNPKESYKLFAFAGKFIPGKECFYKELCDYIKTQKNWPSNLRVIPLSFQNPEHLVNLELKCNTITRSGGGTVMELLVLHELVEGKKSKLKPKMRFIHAQKVKGRDLESSIPLWERGNYLHLRGAVGSKHCKVVDPHEMFRDSRIQRAKRSFEKKQLQKKQGAARLAGTPAA
ncbi:hypothetical protein [Estrella lausannensis]|uniref:Uncharacterized protein n=1 Tax=Estrella lausannensis TaxID=483423 RepID=A0A0H5DTD7_9BACT|nr:hypothetical protein [Estrella lausannensis]CRX39094.1 hypothetical protein ELAC_1767 [Estrella lausannensis]